MSDLGAGGVSASLILASLENLVRATNAQAQIIKGNLGIPASGDIAGIFPGPLIVTATHLAAPLPAIQGGTGNTTGQPAGAAGGALAGLYPNPTLAAGAAEANIGVLALAKGGTGNATGQPSGAAGGDLSGTFPNPAVAQVAGVAVAPGAWVPVLRFGAASVGITYGTQSGSVIRIGKLTIAHFTIILTSKGVSVGAATIAGLPVACGALDGAVVISSHAVMATANVFECAVAAGTAIIALGLGNAVASAALADTDFTNTTAIAGTATYIAA